MKDIIVIYYAAIAVATFTFLAIGLPEPKGPSPLECGARDTTVVMTTRDRVICQRLRRPTMQS
jgi:hypothetical protein